MYYSLLIRTELIQFDTHLLRLFALQKEVKQLYFEIKLFAIHKRMKKLIRHHILSNILLDQKN